MLRLGCYNGRRFFVLVLPCALSLPSLAVAGPAVRITKVDPTFTFEKAKPGELRQEIVRLTVENAGAAIEASARVRLWGAADHEEQIGWLVPGTNMVNIHVPELPQQRGSPARQAGPAGSGEQPGANSFRNGALSERSELTIVLYRNGESKPVAIEEMPWSPPCAVDRFRARASAEELREYERLRIATDVSSQDRAMEMVLLRLTEGELFEIGITQTGKSGALEWSVAWSADSPEVIRAVKNALDGAGVRAGASCGRGHCGWYVPCRSFFKARRALLGADKVRALGVQIVTPHVTLSIPVRDAPVRARGAE